MGGYRLAGGKGQSSPSDRLRRSAWFWLLFYAPSQLCFFAVPHSLNNAEQLLRANGATITRTGLPGRETIQVTLKLPNTRTERAFHGWLQPDPDRSNYARLVGQTRTSIRAAFS